MSSSIRQRRDTHNHGTRGELPKQEESSAGEEEDPTFFQPRISLAKVTPPTAALASPASPNSVDVGRTREGLRSMESAPHNTRDASKTWPHRKRGVPHVYHDYSNESDEINFIRKKTGGVTTPFPEKLHELLEGEEDTSIVTWLPHGRAFVVRKPKEFTEQVMPKYFRQSKLTSFQRQLNLYGFRRITQGPDAGAYYHELFLRGRHQLSLRMQRQKVKGTGHKQPADAETEPNFYAMPPCSPGSDRSSSFSKLLTDPASVQALKPIINNERNPNAQIEMSPGMEGVHGAAHLLKGMAAGVPAAALDSSNPFSLGVAAHGADSRGTQQTASLSTGSPPSKFSPSSFLSGRSEEGQNLQSSGRRAD